MRVPRILFVLTALSLFLATCGKKTDVRQNGIYFWKTTYHLQPAEIKFIGEHQIRKIYLRLFDIDFDEELNRAIPISRVTFIDSLLPGVEYIPVVYITNRALLHCPLNEIDTLAENTYRQVGYLCGYGNLDYNELQIDCDWTDQTKDKYFALLKTLKSRLQQKQLSTTIRLHQVKYQTRTGIPPADKGVLMFYNMDKLDEIRTQNSILNTSLGMSYLDGKKYPLPLDLALPIYEWTLQFRGQKLLAIHNTLNSSCLSDTLRYRQLNAGNYVVTNGHFKSGRYLMKNDLLRHESIASGNLEEAVAELGNADLPFNNMILFHLDTTHINHYETSFIDKVFAFAF